MNHAGSTASTDRLQDRYGGSSVSPRTAKTLIIALAVVFLALVAWVGVQVANVGVRAETLSYEHISKDRIQVTFQVTMRPGTEALCQVQATNDGRAQVGFVEVPISAQEGPQSIHSVDIATQGTAVSGSVLDCREK